MSETEAQRLARIGAEQMDAVQGMDYRGTRRTAPIQRGAGFLGFVLVSVGLLGFVPGVTQQLGQLAFVGPKSQAELFALVRVSVLVNTIHLAAGLLGFRAVRRGPGASVRYLVGLAVLFFLLFACGVETRSGSPTNFLPVDDAATVVNGVVAVVALLFVIFLNRSGSDVVRQVYLPAERPTEPAPWRETPVVIAGTDAFVAPRVIAGAHPRRASGSPEGRPPTVPDVDPDSAARVDALDFHSSKENVS